MDTTKIEHIAEDLISHNLQRSGLLVAKPKFDREGTDLLAFMEMGDGVKFCRIQCKGRSLIDSNSNVTVPANYVSDGFVLFLFIESREASENNLYCFFGWEIMAWPKNRKNEYRLSLSKTNFSNKLKSHILTELKIETLKGVIRMAETTGEFRRLVIIAPERIESTTKLFPPQIDIQRPSSDQ